MRVRPNYENKNDSSKRSNEQCPRANWCKTHTISDKSFLHRWITGLPFTYLRAIQKYLSTLALLNFFMNPLSRREKKVFWTSWGLFLNLIKNVLSAAIGGRAEQDWHGSDVFLFCINQLQPQGSDSKLIQYFCVCMVSELESFCTERIHVFHRFLLLLKTRL